MKKTVRYADGWATFSTNNQGWIDEESHGLMEKLEPNIENAKTSRHPDPYVVLGTEALVTSSQLGNYAF